MLARCHEFERLKKVISDLDVFYRLSESEDGTFELIKAWKTVKFIYRLGDWGGGIEFERLKKVISDLDMFYRLSESGDGTFELIRD